MISKYYLEFYLYFRNAAVHFHSGEINEKTPLLSNGSVSEPDIFFSKQTADRSAKPSLYRALLRTYCFQWVKVLGYKFITDSFQLTLPITVRLVDYFNLMTRYFYIAPNKVFCGERGYAQFTPKVLFRFLVWCFRHYLLSVS